MCNEGSVSHMPVMKVMTRRKENVNMVKLFRDSVCIYIYTAVNLSALIFYLNGVTAPHSQSPNTQRKPNASS